MRNWFFSTASMLASVCIATAQTTPGTLPPSFFPNGPVRPTAPLPAIRPALPQQQFQPMPGEMRGYTPPSFGTPAQTPRFVNANPQQQSQQQQTANEGLQPQVNDVVRLPQKEMIFAFDGGSVAVRRMTNSWQIWKGGVAFRDFGNQAEAANDATKFIRELRPTHWATIGTDRPMVEYGLTNGTPHSPAFPPKSFQTIDMNSVRAESVRGVWVLRDDASIVVNFGPHRADAEQAAAVCKRYGFNRVCMIGGPVPIMAVLYAHLGRDLAQNSKPNNGMVQFSSALQEQNLKRTGIDVPGVGFVGERLVIDARKLENRKEKSGDWVVAHGPDVIARFGASEWSSRDALKLLQDMRVTEFCKFSDDVTFFLVNGAPPSRVPFSVQSSRFEPDMLRVRSASAGKFGVYEGHGRLLSTVASAEEGEQLIRLLKHYKFDQTCQLGLSGRTGLKFLSKSGR